jgi:hypothetical protein
VRTRNDIEHVGLRVKTDRVQGIVDSVQSLTRQELLVGIPMSEAARDAVPGEEPMDNATIGYIMEYGSPAANIPQRAFLVPGLESVQDEIVQRLSRAARAAIEEKPQEVDKQLNSAGLIAQNGVRAKITDGPFLPLSPRTLAGRRRKGRTGIKPLLDTEQLRRSVTYVIRDTEDASS